MEQRTIKSFGTFRAFDEENRTAEFIISTESVDSHGTVFKMDGWDLKRYLDNPVVAYNHNASSNDPDDIIGTSEIRRDGDSLVGVVSFEEGNEKAEKVWRKVKNGTLRMASVGAIVHEYRFGQKEGEDKDTLYFTRQELIEWSVVAIGSNKDALKRSIDEIKSELQPIEEEGPTMNEDTATRLRKWKETKLKHNIKTKN